MEQSKPIAIKLLLVINIALPAFLLLAYYLRPDNLTALTIFPAWLWLIFWLPALRKLTDKRLYIGNFLWLIFIGLFIEEISVLNYRSDIIKEDSKTIQVKTINTSGSLKPVSQALHGNPDILLIQESPSDLDLIALLESKPDYKLAYGRDTSIIIRGEFIDQRDHHYFTKANVKIKNVHIQLISLRLLTSDPRIDLWNPSTWKSQKKLRIAQLKQINNLLQSVDQSLPIIVGGDLNVPQGDRVFFDMKNYMNDSFAICGKGLGNTILSTFPVLRIDQIWYSNHLVCNTSKTNLYIDTDHRGVSASLSYKQN